MGSETERKQTRSLILPPVITLTLVRLEQLLKADLGRQMHKPKNQNIKLSENVIAHSPEQCWKALELVLMEREKRGIYTQLRYTRLSVRICPAKALWAYSSSGNKTVFEKTFFLLIGCVRNLSTWCNRIGLTGLYCGHAMILIVTDTEYRNSLNATQINGNEDWVQSGYVPGKAGLRNTVQT